MEERARRPVKGPPAGHNTASVSRRHAIIAISGDEATLTDLGSKNGTWIDGRRVAGPVHLAGTMLASELRPRSRRGRDARAH